MGNYDEFAETYAEQTSKMDNELRQRLYSLLPTLKAKKLLDVGCGSGQDAEYYTQQGAEVSGIDLSQREIALAKQRCPGNFVIGSMDHLPFDSNTFDVVTSTYALQACSHVTLAINEMIRVAKPRAPIIIAAKDPIRNLLEGYINDRQANYFAPRIVTSHIFNGAITLHEPGHTFMEYFDQSILAKANLRLFEQHNDYPASAQVIPEMIYPTCMILKYLKRGK